MITWTTYEDEATDFHFNVLNETADTVTVEVNTAVRTRLAALTTPSRFPLIRPLSYSRTFPNQAAVLSVTPGPLPLRAIVPPGKRVSLGVIRSKENVSYEWNHRRGDAESATGAGAPAATSAPEEEPEVFEQVSDEQGVRSCPTVNPPELQLRS